TFMEPQGELPLDLEKRGKVPGAELVDELEITDIDRSVRNEDVANSPTSKRQLGGRVPKTHSGRLRGFQA
ncbi:MAG: hypothetical protein ACRDLK_13045, partial [Gaiellaceae bacterium]